MKNLKMYCLTLDKNHLNIIKKFNYVPVGLGKDNFDNEWFSDKTGINISKKNPYYGEYTFHYWLWKNHLDKINTDWIGFCQYRKFFLKKDFKEKSFSFNELREMSVNDIDQEINNYDCILGKKFSVENYKLMKIIKHHFIKFLFNPTALLYRKKRTLKFK